MNGRFLGKYFLACLLSTFLAGPVVAQNVSHDKKKTKSESPVNDSTAKNTLTHMAPNTGVQVPTPPKRRAVLVGHVDDSYQIDAAAFVHMTLDGVRAKFAPRVVAKPFVRFLDKYTIGVNAEATIQNYTDKNFAPIVDKMYLFMAARTKIGTFGIKIGKMPAIEYPTCFNESVPGGNYLLHRTNFDSGRFMPRAAVATYKSNDTEIGLGYGENGDGFGFAGNGYAIITLKQNIGDEFQIGGFILTNPRQFCCDAYTMYQPSSRDMIMFQALNMGVRPTFYGIYRHIFKNNEAAIAINGFAQSDDGAAGADIGFQHIKSGTYISAGAHYRDPMNAVADAPAKWQPFVQIGINKTLSPRKFR